MPRIATDRPLQRAVEQITRKTPVGSSMSSAEWELVAADVRFRAMFSARVEDERLLAEMQERLQARIELAKREGRTMDRGVFMEEMRQILRENGYQRPQGVKRGSLQDLRSHRRLGLIWDMNLAQAQGYARWQADMTVEGLENEPCYELIRVMERMEHRDWPAIWRMAGGQFFDGPGSNDDYPLSEGRMIALKTDPIWRTISRFNTPWPPFEWGSGMGLRGVGRSESDAFGITLPNQVFTPLRVPFNDQLEASVAGIPEAGRSRLLEQFQGEVALAGDKLQVLPAPQNVPNVVIFPSPITEGMRKAAELLREWPESKLEKLAKLLDGTLAWRRYKAALKAPRTHEAMIRAVAQFLAGPDGKQAIDQVRATASRDAFWCRADFWEVEQFLTTKGDLP